MNILYKYLVTTCTKNFVIYLAIIAGFTYQKTSTLILTNWFNNFNFLFQYNCLDFNFLFFEKLSNLNFYLKILGFAIVCYKIVCFKSYLILQILSTPPERNVLKRFALIENIAIGFSQKDHTRTNLVENKRIFGQTMKQW